MGTSPTSTHRISRPRASPRSASMAFDQMAKSVEGVAEPAIK